ncbi:hypothetical protein BGX23_008524 [Mortierella sp. AD031]|nr:hypothetical protein BGX23_008524 [Mortierella sp. AD031]
MQTVGLDQILSLAKETNCDIFNFSVIRWLGDNVRSTTINTTTNNSNSMGLKLFHKIRCECGTEAVIAKGPTIPSSYRRASKEKQYVVVCRARAFTDPNFEIVEPSRNDTFYGYHDHHGRAFLQPGRKSIRKCSFCVSLDIAIYWCHNSPIHKQIDTNDWLSQWFLSKPSLTSRAASGSSRSLSAAPQRGVNHMVSTLRAPRRAGSKRSGTSIQMSPSPLMPTISRRTSTSTVPPTGYLTAQDLGGQFGRSTSTSALDRGLGQGRYQLGRDSTRLEELDHELEEVVAWHAAEVESILDANERWLMPTQKSLSAFGYSSYQVIDMNNCPSVTMLLCNNCTDNTTGFCVIPCGMKHGSPALPTNTTRNTTWTTDGLLPPSLPNFTNGRLDATDEADLLTGSGCMNPELESVDRELDRMMKRHAEGFLKTMETRSRLVPDFLPCRACECHASDRDVVPCNHLFFCTDCLDLIEFYVVPRTNPSGQWL